jgi:acyl transferase domain-containing protein
LPWPEKPYKRASINSFGYGGTNSHVILDELASFTMEIKPNHVSSYLSLDTDPFSDDEDTRPHLLVLSANDESSLRASCEALDQHLSSLDVKVSLPDLAYTLSERRSHHFHRAYAVVKNTDVGSDAFSFAKKNSEPPKIGFVFTGQGAQWPQMGKQLLETFPSAKKVIASLDAALQQLPTPPSWSILGS